MTVSELIAKLKDCAPGAEVFYFDSGHGGVEIEITEAASNAERVELY
jgi:hypothetical protein